MRIVLVVGLLAAGSVAAQTLEQSHAALCADPARSQSETCVALAAALAAKAKDPAASVAPVNAVPTLLFDVGPLATLAGRKFVDATGTLEIYVDEGGRAFVLHFGKANGPRGTKFVFRAGGQPGVFPGEMVFHVGSSPTITGLLRPDGSLHVVSSQNTMSTSYAVSPTGVLATALKDGAYVAQYNYVPVTQGGLDLAQAGAAVRDAGMQERAQAKIDEERARQATAQNFMQGLQQIANESAAPSPGSYAEAQANLDATVATIQANAAAEARVASATAPTPAPVASPTVSATPMPQADTPAPIPAGQAPGASEAAGVPLRFILQVTLATVINGNNASCYSNIVSIPGPPGWPSPSMQQGGTMPARALIDAYMAAFQAKCGAIAPLGGSVNYHWNMKGSEHNTPEMIQEFGRKHGFPFVQL